MSLMLSVEARNVVVKQLDIFDEKVKDSTTSKKSVSSRDTPMTVTSAELDSSSFSEHPQLTAPDANLMLEALTPRLTRENVDSGNLYLLRSLYNLRKIFCIVILKSDWSFSAIVF